MNDSGRLNFPGLSLCSRFCCPPNRLSLCGPDVPSKQKDLVWYSETGNATQGTGEIVAQFSTLYPYLCLIASQNNISDPFDERVVEAYWIGNKLLGKTSIRPFALHLTDTLTLKKKMPRRELERILEKLPRALPHHSFHVLNIYKRTGNLDIVHTIETMEACLIMWGQVEKVESDTLVVKTNPLRQIGDKLGFDGAIRRTISTYGNRDIFMRQLHVGDFVSYHWGYFCQKLSLRQAKNLSYYTNLSLKMANLR